MTFEWSTVLDETELASHHAHTATIDARFAKAEQSFYAAQSVNSLRALASRCWYCNDRTGYVLAKSYLALQRT